MRPFAEVKKMAQQRGSAASTKKNVEWEELKGRARKNILSSNPNADRDISSWFDGLNQLGQRAQKYLSADGYKAPDRDMEKEIDSYLSRAGEIKSLISASRDKYADYESVLKGYDEAYSYLKELKTGVPQSNAFYAQFTPTEEQMAEGHTAESLYDQWHTDYTKRQKYEGLTYQQIQDKLNIMPKDSEDYQWLTEYAPTVMTAEDYDAEIAARDEEITNLESVLEEYDKLTKQVSTANPNAYANVRLAEIRKQYGSSADIQGRLESLKATRLQYENDKQYKLLSQNEDFAEKSGYVSTATEEDWWTKAHSQYGLGYSDLTYEYINNQNDIRATIRRAAGGNSQAMADYDRYEQLSEDEVANYNYLSSTQGKKAAEEYLKSLQSTLNQRATEAYAQKVADFAGQNFWTGLGASAASVPANLLSGAGYLNLLGQKAVKGIQEIVTGEYAGPVDYNTPAMRMSVGSSTARRTVTQKIADNTGVINLDPDDHPVLSRLLNGKSLGDVYQLGMSVADSGATAILSMAGLGSGATLLLGGSAATQTTLEAAANGATDEQALTMGALSGAFEYLFEKYELENLIGNVDDGVLKALFKQSLSEGFGEGMTSVANLAADSLIMADKSEISRLAAQYMAENPSLTEGEAWAEAMKDIAIGIGWDAVGGMAMGGIMGGTGAAVNKVVNKVTDARNDALMKLAAEKIDAEQQGQEMENTAPESGVKYSIRNTSQMSLKEQLNKYYKNQLQSSDALYLGETPTALEGSGLTAAPLVLTTSNYKKSVTQKHNVPRRVLNKLAENLQNPILSFGSNGQVGILIDDIDGDGKPVLVAIHGNQTMDRESVNEVKSIYGLDNPAAWIKNQIDAGKRFKAYNEEKANTFLQTYGYSASVEGEVRSMESITETDPGVNGEIPSTEGKILRGRDAVEVADIATAGGGKVTVTLTDGSNADASELSFRDAGEQELYRVIAQYADNAEAARQLLKEYRAGSMDAYAYARGAEEAMLYGRANISEKEMEVRGSYVNQMDPMQRKMAYTLGQISGEKRTRQRQAEASERNAKRQRKGSVNYGYEGQALDKSKLTKAQRVGVDFAERLARKKGMTFYFYRSYVNDQGQRVYKDQKGRIVAADKNGWYNPENGSIHIDLNCGDMGGTVLFTLAHELTHFIQDWSPKKYRTLCGILTEGYLDMGQSIQELVQHKQEDYKAKGEELSYEEAFDEVIASSMEGVLADGRVMELLDEIETKDQSLYEKVRSFIEDVAALIHETIQAYRDLKPDSPEGRIVERMQGIHEQLKQVFAEGLHEGGENYRQGGKENTTQEGGVKSALRAFDDGTRFVDVQMDATVFSNLTVAEMNRKVKAILMERFAGKVIGIDNRVFVNGDSVNEYLHPSKNIDRVTRETKLVAGSELDNLLDAGTPLPNEPDGKDGHIHPEVKDFSYLKTIFKVGNEYFEGIVNIKNVSKGRLLKDITKIRNITKDIVSSYGSNPKSNFLRDVSMDSIRSSLQKVNKNSVRYQKNAAAREHLEKENASMGEDVAGLNELVAAMRRQGNRGNLQKSTLDASASVLMEKAGARGKKTELMELLDTFYQHIGNGEDLSWDGIRQAARPVVDWLMDHVARGKQISEYAREVLNELRTSRIYLDETQKGEAAHQFGSYGAFRNMLMGSVTIANEGSISLDSRWHELSQLYPDVFREDVSAADMPGELVDIINRMRNTDTSELEFEYNREFMEQELLYRIYGSYWNASTLYIVAGQHEAQIRQLKGKHNQRMNEVYQRHRDMEERQRQSHRQRQEAARHHYEEQYQKREAEYRESRRKAVERHDKSEMKHKVLNVVKELNSLLVNGGKERHIPEQLQLAVTGALEAINMETVDRQARMDKLNAAIEAETDPDIREALLERKKQLEGADNRFMEQTRRLKDAYRTLKDSTDSMEANGYDEVIMSRVEEVVSEVGSTPLRDMTIQQLEQVYEMYTMILTMVRNVNKAFTAQRDATISGMGKNVIRELRSVGKEQTKAIKALESIKAFAWSDLKPVYAFKMIGSNTLSKLFHAVRSGEDTWAVDVTEAKDFYREQADKYGYDEWDMKKQYKFYSNTGQSFNLSLEQIMSLYAYSKRAQADEHLDRGGFVFDSAIEVEEKKKGVPVKYKVNTANAFNLSKERLQGVCESLTAEQKAFVDAMQEYLSTTMGAKGNEISMQMYGIKLFKEKNYFPLKSAGQYMFSQDQAAGEVRLKNSGFSKKTVPKAGNPIILSNFMDVWTNHVDEMSMYHAFVLPLEDFNRVFNFKTPALSDTDIQGVKAQLQNIYGEHPGSYISQLITQLNGGVRSDPTEGFFHKRLADFKKAAVFMSLSVAVQQPSAISRAAAYLDSKYFIGKNIKGNEQLKLAEEMKKYAPVALIKEMGYFDTDVGRSTKDYIMAKEYRGFKEKVKGAVTDKEYRDELMGALPAKMDELTWSTIWQATKREIRDKHPELRLGSEAFLKAAGERFTEIVIHTQVYDSVLAKSAMMRSKSFGMKMVTSFMAEPTTSINMVADALVQGKRGDRRYCRKAIGGVIASQILNAMLVAVVYAMRDDDEDETYGEKYLEALAGKLVESFNPLSYIPFFKDIVSICSGYTVERSDMSVVADIYKAWQKLDDPDVSAWKKVEDFGGSICNLFGLPLGNIMRDVRGLWITATGIGNGPQSTWSGAVNALLEGVTGKDRSKQYRLYSAVIRGDQAEIQRVRAEFDSDAKANSALVSEVKTQYLEGKLTKDKVIGILTEHAGKGKDPEKDEDPAQDYITKWDFQKVHPDTGLSGDQQLNYVEMAEPAGISLEVYIRYCEEAALCESDKDKDGKSIRGSEKNKVVAVIHSLPLTGKQKDTLYLLRYAQSGLKDTPWH